MAPLSTPEVARLVGIHPITLEKWIARGVIPSPRRLAVGKHVVRLWSRKDIERVQKYKLANYNKKPRRRKAASAKVKRSKP
jgi:excisionase family DNA binding protein